MINPALKNPSFETVELHETLGPRLVMADERYLRQGMFALDDYGPWYTDSFKPLGTRIVSSAMILRDLHNLIGYYYDPARMMGLHQRESVRFHRPVPVGTLMSYEGRFTSQYVRRGKGYVVFEAQARDAATGELLVSRECSEIMQVSESFQGATAEPEAAPARRVTPVDYDDADAVSRAAPGLAVGTPVKRLVKPVHQDQISVFSGCDMQWVNIHTSVERAHVGNYPDTLLAGLMQTCWLSEMAANFYGEEWLYSGTIDQVYLKPVFRNDELALHGVVTESDPAAESKLSLQVWSTNGTGDMTAAGWVSCNVR